MADNVFFDSSKNRGIVVLSNNNLTANVSNNISNARTNIGRSSGKWYWEVKVDSKSNTAHYIGITDSAIADWSSTNIRAYANINSSSMKRPEGTAYGKVFNSGDILSVLLDLDVGALEFWRNGQSVGISHTNLKELGEVFPLVGHSTSGNPTTFTANFGATSFAYSLPMNYKSYDGSQSNVHKFLISSEDEYYSVSPEVMGTETAIPLMTSNTTPSGRAFASSIYSTGYDAWYAFNRADEGEGYITDSNTAIGHLGYEFVKPIAIGKYAVRSNTNSSRYSQLTKDWTFEGSNDGINWDILDTQINQIWTTTITDKEYFIDINKVNIYKMYRLNWTANNGHRYTSVNELKMYEYTPPKLLILPNQSVQTFINHGINKDISIDLTTTNILERRYIVQDNVELGSGKVFKQKIDTTKIPIRSAVIE